MNRRNLLIGLFVLFVAVACDLFPQPSSDIACDPNGCISLSQFSLNIALALNGQVDGYVVHVGGVAPVAWGQARTSADSNPPLAMATNLPIQLASVSKTLTTIRVLQSLSKHNLTIDDKISPYIWPNWKQGPGINNITFKDLLTHRSGFLNWQMCNGNNTTYAVLKQLISQGITVTVPTQNGTYNNCNFAIFREMMMFMEGQSYSGTDTQQAGMSASWYITYMNQYVFGPLGIYGPNGSGKACAPLTGSTNEILSYPLPAGSTHGDDWGDWTFSCGGGGWVLSADDLFKVVNDLATGNVLLTNAEKADMFSDCLGWDCAVRNDCPNPYGTYPYVCKNGGLDNGNFHLRTYIGIFQCNVPVVVIVNSNMPSPDDPIPIVENAYNGAKVQGTPAPCPVQLTQQVRVLPSQTAEQTRTPIPLLPQPRLTLEPQSTATRTQTPRPPILIAPIDGIAVDCGQATLTWKPADDPSGIRDYDVELEKLVDPSYVSEKTWSNVFGASTSFDASCGTRYRWHVRVTDNAGKQSDWSSYGYFRARESVSTPPTPTATPPPRDKQAPRPPTQIAPIDSVSVDCVQLNLTWKPAEDPSGIRDYDVELQKLVDRTFAAEKTWNNVRGESESFVPSCDTHYRWRIRATDNAGNQGSWSDYQDFQVRAIIQ